VNRFFAIGNLTKDPEMRYTPSGKAVTEFSIAVNEGRGETRTTEFIDCQCWEKLAETVAEHMRKGRKVLIEGRYTTDKWTDTATGKPRSRVRIRCSNVEFLDAPRETAAPSAPAEDADLTGINF
jgi:single-strand DNA-binding protein